MDADDEAHRRLLSIKAEKLEALGARKPGQKGYKRRLRAFLEADAAVQAALLARIDWLLDQAASQGSS